MKVLVQRSKNSSVKVNGEVVGSATFGLTLFVGIASDDTQKNLDKMADKILNLRIFNNEEGRFDKSVLEIGGDLLLIPQFTLFADTSHGRRPEFFKAMEPNEATKMFDKFVSIMKSKIGDAHIGTGIFGANMQVYVENDGPVSIMVEI